MLLHWNSWWSPALQDETDELTQAPPRDAAPGADDSLAGLQARLWDQWLDAHRSWWTMYAANLPTMPWPPAGVLVPPPEPAAEPALKAEASRKKASPSQRLRPVASGPAAAKLKQQRKR